MLYYGKNYFRFGLVRFRSWFYMFPNRTVQWLQWFSYPIWCMIDSVTFLQGCWTMKDIVRWESNLLCLHAVPLASFMGCAATEGNDSNARVEHSCSSLKSFSFPRIFNLGMKGVHFVTALWMVSFVSLDILSIPVSDPHRVCVCTCVLIQPYRPFPLTHEKGRHRCFDWLKQS